MQCLQCIQLNYPCSGQFFVIVTVHMAVQEVVTFFVTVTVHMAVQEVVTFFVIVTVQEVVTFSLISWYLFITTQRASATSQHISEHE
jgi:hypothetical protein